MTNQNNKMITTLRVALLFLLLFFCPSVWSRELLERKIDVRFSQTPLREALTTVARAGGFEWSYNANILDAQKKVSLIANDWTIREILYAILGEGFFFKTNGNYLIIKKVKKATDQISGYVKDPRTGTRIAGATVFDKKTLRATTTDSNGYYSLKVKRNADIVVAKLEFRDTLLRVTPLTPRFVPINLQEVPPDTVQRDKKLNESLQIIGYQLNQFFDATLEKWHQINLRDSVHRQWQVSFLPKMGTNHTLSGQVINEWSFNILSGYAQGVGKLEIGGLGNFTRTYVHGVQIGGLFNFNSGELRGTQIGGLFNVNNKNSRGVMVGGLFNMNNGVLEGVQVGGVFNVARSSLKSLQVGGTGNIANSVNGGIQIGGVTNWAHKGSLALQISGTLNRADTIQGAQISGFINRAKVVNGLQFGIVNSTKSCNCVQIGLINYNGKRWMPIVNASKRRKTKGE